MNEVEVRWLWDMVGELDATSRAYFLVLLLTGQRRDEVRELVRGELDMSRPWMDLSEARMKSGYPHITPFADKARDLIAGPLAAHNYRYVFPSLRAYVDEAAYTIYDLGNALDFLNAAMERKAKAARSAYERWTAHDLRRTFSTLANGILDDEENAVLGENHIEGVMGHKVGGRCQTPITNINMSRRSEGSFGYGRTRFAGLSATRRSVATDVGEVRLDPNTS
ncbi:tyrosine-type recombinase/integrase [Novosphingobium sp. HR1a]|uniref:tyrosine-type recombinase/integrase n=1 Tax=Novosphingobium sp. HR1a TaxID=1395637 RepID=UPI00211349BD|nr:MULTISPECIES: tyrosine-type recombinase/integrase [Novosphingobium]